MIIVVEPNKLKERYLVQIIDLIVAGGQIQKKGLKEKIRSSQKIAFKVDKEIIIATATIKTPLNSYKNKIFNLACVKSASDFNSELGYISTHKDFEGQGHCQDLVRALKEHFSDLCIYATTRKPAMMHILKKVGFTVAGNTYNKDLRLLIHCVKKGV